MQPTGMILTTASPKTMKGERLGYLTGILYMTPARTETDGVNLCPAASPGCLSACLVTAGRGAFPAVASARAARRRLFLTDPDTFRAALCRDIEAVIRRARRAGMKPAFRLNGTTDVDWSGFTDPFIRENYFLGGESIPQRYKADATFYEYSKVPKRFTRLVTESHGLDLTFSLSENNSIHARRALADGWRVAAVFDVKPGEPKPSTWEGFPVTDGDAHDLTFLHPGGIVLGLSAKGRARRDSSGFVQSTDRIDRAA